MPILAWLPRYDKAWLVADVLAGLTLWLAIKDNLAEFAYDTSAERLFERAYNVVLPDKKQSPKYLLSKALQKDPSLARLHVEGIKARGEIDKNYSDQAIARRVGVPQEFVQHVRKTHALYKGRSAKGCIQCVAQKVNKQREADALSAKQGEQA